MFEDLSVDVQDIKIKLPPSVSALFEPVSGVMVMNVPDEEFDAMRRDFSDPLAELFLHEMYHCFQAYCTGYQFNRVCELRDVLFAELQPRKAMPVLVNYLKSKMVLAFTACLPRGLKTTFRAWYYTHRLMRDRDELAQLMSNGQPSMMGARYPNLHRRLTAAKQGMLAVGDDGLTANDLLEGAAVVYARLAYQMTAVTATQMLAELKGLNETYTRALQITVDACGERAIRVLLPSVSLALQYERPENAYVEIMKLILRSEDGEELAAAKRLAADLPHLNRAGRAIGTAVAAARRIRKPSKVYEVQMNALRSGSWGIDELDLLTDPKAVSSVPYGSLGFGVVTRAGIPRGFPDGRGSLMIAAIMLRGGPSIHQEQMDVDRRAIKLARDLLSL